MGTAALFARPLEQSTLAFHLSKVTSGKDTLGTLRLPSLNPDTGAPSGSQDHPCGTPVVGIFGLKKMKGEGVVSATRGRWWSGSVYSLGTSS